MDFFLKKYSGIILLGLSLLGLFLSFKFGALFDYKNYYQNKWQIVLAGSDPWINDGENTYPPLFFFLAGIYWLHPILPKILFGLASIAIHLLIWWRATESSFMSVKAKTILFLCLCFAPYVWIFGFWLGNADPLIALVTIVALHYFSRNGFVWAGIFLGLGMMLKVYPGFLFPLLFLICEGKNQKAKFAASFFATAGLSLFISWTIWGNSIFLSAYNAVSYEGELMSLFGYLNTRFPNVRLFVKLGSISFDLLPQISVFFGFAGVTILCRALRVPLMVAALCVMAVVLSIFQIGHLQYFGIVAFLIYFSMVHSKSSYELITRSKIVWALFLTMQFFFVLYGITLAADNDPTGLNARNWMGLPISILTFLMIAELLVRWKSMNQEARA